MTFSPRPTITLEELLSRCEPIPHCGCYVWMGGDSGKGDDKAHGKVWFNGRCEQVHRVSYSLAKGPIPEGYHIDHLCKLRLCANPEHLEAVEPILNYDRGEGPRYRFRSPPSLTPAIPPEEPRDALGPLPATPAAPNGPEAPSRPP